MKKDLRIAIISIYDNNNYGNRLQNFAMYKILSEFGNTQNVINSNAGNKINFKLKENFSHILKFLRGRKLEAKREINFKKFSKKKIKNSKFIITQNCDFSALARKFDYFIAGSDQIWNPNFYENKMYVVMLGFAPRAKRIAVAPSIAIDNLSKIQKEEFKKYLCDFEALSCREQQGADMISNLINKPVEALIDPTLVLTNMEWQKFAKKPKFHSNKERYILLYFLGNLLEEYSSFIKKVAEIHNLKIINILDKNSKYFTAGPQEFVYLINNCEVLFTDSFHGAVFAFNLKKPFRIFTRIDNVASMNSRLLNLKNKLNLSDQVFFNENEDISEILTMNYDHSALKFEREKFYAYLENLFKREKQ